MFALTVFLHMMIINLCIKAFQFFYNIDRRESSFPCAIYPSPVLILPLKGIIYLL